MKQHVADFRKPGLSPLDLNHACSTIEPKSSKLKDRLSKKLDKTFNALKRKKGIPQLSNLDNDSIIFNYSHHLLRFNDKGRKYVFFYSCWVMWDNRQAVEFQLIARKLSPWTSLVHGLPSN